MRWSLRQGDSFSPSCLILVLTILMFAILLPFGQSLLDLPGVFVGAMGIWILPKDSLL